MLSRLPLNSKPHLSKSFVCRSCREKLSAANPQQPLALQKRWITQNHIRRIKDAMADWEFRAQAIRKGEKQSMLSLLEERGYVNQIVGTREDLDYILTQRRVGAYVGVDATAPSLHIGHLVPFMALGWLYIHGYGATYLLGGLTARIGDPTDRLTAREAPTKSARKANFAGMHQQLKRLGASVERYAERKGYQREWAWRREVANNGTWFTKVPVSDFMRILGSSVRLGPMLGRETVKYRLEQGNGMSFAEFAYPLMQAWDWWHLFQKGVQVQIGGADQFGNILAGAEAIKAMKKVEPIHFMEDGTFQGHVGSQPTASLSQSGTKDGRIDEPIGFTVPLLTTSAGAKFGKSEGNAIWLDKEMTSALDLYRFFARSADADVEKYLKLFTFLPITEINGIMEEHHLDESKGYAQSRLAFEAVDLIHGPQVAQDTQRQHQQLLDPKGISINSLRADSDSAAEVATKERSPGTPTVLEEKPGQRNTFATTTSVHITLPRSLVLGQPFAKVLWSAGMVSSRSEGQRLISNKGCRVGSKAGKDGRVEELGDSMSFTPVPNDSTLPIEQYIIDGDLLILRIGKWKMKIIKIVSDKEYESSGLTCPGWRGERSEHGGEMDGNKQSRQKASL